MVDDAPLGTIRIGKDLFTYQKTATSWKRIKQDFPHVMKAVKLFKSHSRFNELIDSKNPKFLKGQLSPEGLVRGARLNILPDGKKLDKAYSLFAEHLTYHDEDSHDHWDVIYQNPNGKYAYLYTQEKRKNAVNAKYKKVAMFEKVYPHLESRVLEELSNSRDSYALPIYTLLKTYMRVGNETYYKANGHKGLTTLKKKDITLDKNKVKFNYIAKSGVPMTIIEEFPAPYVKRLKEKLGKLKNSDFIFTDENKHPLKDTAFMKAFEDYCGERFYPHIVRSFYATKTVKDFIHSRKSATKDEVRELFTLIADKLGHRRFDKKANEWKHSYTVTIHHYIEPKLVEKVNSLVK